MNIFYENLAKVNQPFEEQYKAVFADVLDSGWFVLGAQVAQFEQAFAQRVGVQYAIGVANGLDALTLSFMALDYPAGSEVLVAANAYIATIIAILRAGLVPVLVEPNLSDGNIDVSQLRSALTSKTCAILPLHLYGHPCDMAPIVSFAKTHHLSIVEDCAQAHDARYHSQMVGSFGDLGAWSFYPTKNLGALGDGGAITTNSDALAERLYALRNYGSHQKYENKYIGLNSRLDEIQAAFLNIKINALQDITQHKQRLAKQYQQGLKNDLITWVSPQAEKESVYHIFSIRCAERDRLRQYLADNQIKTEIHYPIAPYHQQATKHLFDQSFPVSDEWHHSILSLPISYAHTEKEIDYVIQIINEFPS